MKKNTTGAPKPLEINPTTLIQLDPEAIEDVVGGMARESTKTSDSCDRCTQCRKACDTDR